MYTDDLPTRVRVLVLGGGIHGAGLLHDMASRGWKDIHLIERDCLGAGTSSKSTKLIHGGLRYLKRVRDFGLVAEALRERKLLMNLVPDLVKPVELVFPILRKGGMPRVMVKAGLLLYDRLAGRFGIGKHRWLSPADIQDKASVLNQDMSKGAYSFWDGQTDDLALVRRVGASARKLGASISEGAEALRLRVTDDGYDCDVRLADGRVKTVSALYIVNCLGPWANAFLEQSGISPTHRAINDKGIHILYEDIGLKAGLFLQSPSDDRIFFVLPWQGYTLIGTTEELYNGNPDELSVREDEVRYLFERCNKYLRTPLTERGVVRVFAGLRWLAVEAGHSITETTRAYTIGELESRRGLLLTIYGGKLTTYRNLAKTLGDQLSAHFGEFKKSRTDEPECWATAAETPGEAVVLDRFKAFS